MKFHESMARALAEHEVDTVFGVLGDANLYMMEAFRRLCGGTYVAMAHESAAVLAALGFAQTSGRTGVATVTHGPALTNTVTALIEGVKSRTAMVLIAGDTAVADQENVQNVAQSDVVLSTGAGFEQVRSPGSGASDLSTAFRRAGAEQRPIVLNVPRDFQWCDVEHAPQRRSQFSSHVAGDPEAMDAALGMVGSAHRPIILAGRGAISPESRTALLRLADILGCPVATTVRAKDLFRGSTRDLGIFGSLSPEPVYDVISRSDCIVAFGASLNTWTTAERSLVKGRSVVQVDIDPRSLGRWCHVNCGVLGDTARVADEMVSMLEAVGHRAAGTVAEGRPAPGSASELGDTGRDGLDARVVLARIEEKFPSDRTIVLDVGKFWYTAISALSVPEPRAYVHTLNSGSIGLSMGYSVGACLGVSRPTLTVVGDGGFMNGGLGEFNTAVRYGLDLTVCVLNDGAYGAEYVQFEAFGLDPSISEFDWPDLGSVAQALGGVGFTVRTIPELDAALDGRRSQSIPTLINIITDRRSMPRGSH